MPAPLRFRAWHVEQKRMYSPEEMGADELTLAVDGRGLMNVSGVSPRLSQYAGNRMIVMQSTGRRDRNGVELFEGDVVGCRGLVVVIEWKQFDAADDADTAKTGFIDLEGTFGEKPEMIGNVHANPELLPPA